MKHSLFVPLQLSTKVRYAVLFGLIFGLLGLLLSALPIVQSLEEKYGLSWLFSVRGPIDSPNSVVIASMDRHSEQIFNIPSPQIAPWPRALHACLLETLDQQQVSLIVFDVFFRKRDDLARSPDLSDQLKPYCSKTSQYLKNNISQNEILAKMIKQNGKVLLAQKIAQETRVTEYGSITLEKPLLPDDIFAHSALGTAPFTLPIINGHLARFNITQQVGQQKIPTLPTLAAQYVPKSNSAREILPTSKSFQYLNFLGPAGSVCSLSFVDLLSGNLQNRSKSCPKDFNLNGKIIFIGEGWSNIITNERKDDFWTAFDSDFDQKMHGVEVMATALINLLQNTSISPISKKLTMAIIFTILLIFGFILSYLSGYLSVVAGFTLILIISLTNQLLFNLNNLWLPIFFPLITLVPLAVASGLFIKYRSSKKVIERYVSKRVAKKISQNAGQKQHAEETNAICLSTDIENYTGITEKLSRQQLVNLTNQYFSELTKIIVSKGGEKSDIVGDGGTWFWPTNNRQNRLNACLAVFQIQAAVECFNQKHPSSPFYTRCGLHLGPVSMGDFGEDRHLTYTIIGDGVNTASRIENLNKQVNTRILASLATVSDLQQYLLFRPIGSFLFIGKTKPIDIVEVICEKKHASEQQAHLAELSEKAIGWIKKGSCTKALSIFNEIERLIPNDGPTRYYLDLIKTNPEQCQSTIRLTKK